MPTGAQEAREQLNTLVTSMVEEKDETREHILAVLGTPLLAAAKKIQNAQKALDFTKEIERKINGVDESKWGDALLPPRRCQKAKGLLGEVKKWDFAMGSVKESVGNYVRGGAMALLKSMDK